MRFCKCLLGAVLLALLVQGAAWAEIKVTVDRNGEAEATPRFKFKTVPSPAGSSEAAAARFIIVDGDPDDASGDLKVLHDGKMPSEEDQPETNFFFAQGEDGGRLEIDMGKAVEVKQVNTYSWHPGTRGPQVYKLYAADGAGTGFNAQPKRATDPAKCGWKLLAKVDTRPTAGDVGGQYGVSVADSAGAIGKYRYLLLDISATETDDAFGNTFYSEIDVIDTAGSKPREAEAAARKRLISKSPAAAAYQITIDYTDAPELKDWVEKKLQPTADQWYPRLIAALPSKDYKAPTTVAVAITNGYGGVAATGGNHVACNASWFKRNYNGEALGAVVHELVHVVQRYGGRAGAVHATRAGWSRASPTISAGSSTNRGRPALARETRTRPATPTAIASPPGSSTT